MYKAIYEGYNSIFSRGGPSCIVDWIDCEEETLFFGGNMMEDRKP